jgi:transcriptional regulator with XRE-family HTH domain
MREIAKVLAARERIGVARDAYAAAVVAALDAGVSVAQLAEELGVSRQAVNQLRKRRASVVDDTAELEARAADIRGRWDESVRRYGEQWESPALDRIMQAKKNGVARKRARKGLPRLATVAEERRGYAEGLLLEAIRRSPDRFVKVRAELEELARLERILESRMEARSGIFG